jgi:hypothetical protein
MLLARVVFDAILEIEADQSFRADYPSDYIPSTSCMP